MARTAKPFWDFKVGVGFVQEAKVAALGAF